MGIILYFPMLLRHHFTSILKPCRVKQIKINKQTKHTKYIWDRLCSLKIAPRSGSSARLQDSGLGNPGNSGVRESPGLSTVSVSTFSGHSAKPGDRLTIPVFRRTRIAEGLAVGGFRSLFPVSDEKSHRTWEEGKRAKGAVSVADRHQIKIS